LAWGAAARRTAEGLDWGRIVNQIVGHHRDAMAKDRTAVPFSAISPQPADPRRAFAQ